MGTITRRMDSVLDGMQKEFRSFYTKYDFEEVLKQLEKAGTQSNRPSILKKLFDMLDACGVSYETGQDNSYYKKLISSLNIPADFQELEEKMLAVLYEKYQEYPSPEEYMNRIVDRLRFDEDHWGKDSLRVKILKQFVKYGNCLTYQSSEENDKGKPVKVKIYGGEMYIVSYLKEKLHKKNVDIVENVDSIEDDIFLVLDQATKEQKKPTGKYGILKMVNDLAHAQFRGEGATKRSLYLFAMVYGMTYYSGNTEDGEIPDYQKDLEINLFRDYYTNNLMRYLTDSYRGHLSEFERDPSGQGINYKNFAEMIYLYYISKDEYTPQEKIRLSDEMIERVRIYGLSHETPASDIETGDTAFYRRLAGRDNGNILYSEDILNLSVSDFEAYLCEHYDCNTKHGLYVLSPMQLESEQNTAYQVYLEILADLKKLGTSLQECRYGLWLTDVPAIEKRNREEILEKWPDLDLDKFDNFMDLLAGADNFMKDNMIKDKETITRTSVIVAYYYDYNAEHEVDSALDQRSFQEVFSDFKCGVDEKLDEAYYQPFSSKNIFDVLVAFSAYAYLHM